MKSISKEKLSSEGSYPRLLVLTTDQRQIEFQENKYIIESDTLKGEGIELVSKKDNLSKPFSGNIPVSDIVDSSSEQFVYGGTIILVGLAVILLGLGLTFDPIKDN
jgi:hypothetical protein